MGESARLPGHSVRVAAARQVRECLYSVLRREHGLYAHRVWQASSTTSCSLLFARSKNGKYERTTNYSVSLRAKGAHIRINPLTFQELVPRRGPLTRDNTAPTKRSNSYLRYYTRTRIIQGQIWVPNEVEFARNAFHGTEDSLISEYPIYSPICDNDNNGNTNFKGSEMRS